MNRVAIIIVTYNSINYIDDLVQSLQDLRHPEMLVIFIDNASRDDTLKKLPDLTHSLSFKNCVIGLSKNIGLLSPTILE